MEVGKRHGGQQADPRAARLRWQQPDEEEGEHRNMGCPGDKGVTRHPARDSEEHHEHCDRGRLKKWPASSEQAAPKLDRRMLDELKAVDQYIVDRPAVRRFVDQDQRQYDASGGEVQHHALKIRAVAQSPRHDKIGQDEIEREVGCHAHQVGHAGVPRMRDNQHEHQDGKRPVERERCPHLR